MKKKNVARKPQPSRRPVVKSARTRLGIHRILVPIDFSGHSKNALQYALQYAVQFQAHLDLLYVVEPTIYPADFSFGQVGFPNIEEELRKRGAEELQALVNNEVKGRVQATATVRTGKPFFEIHEFAREREIDLIIIAAHGHTGVEHILFGSTVEKVVRKSPCPVLVVPTERHAS
ncbi:MAG TPA: universal stress protein [Bacteroidota bacterium]|nr:universal stress protein [Bacteroidota bacterium]